MSRRCFRLPFQGVSYRGVDRPGSCWTRSLMEEPTFTRACLFDVRVIMVIMRVPMVERLRQEVMGWIPAIKCLL
jgi:hypothetical protein